MPIACFSLLQLCRNKNKRYVPWGDRVKKPNMLDGSWWDLEVNKNAKDFGPLSKCDKWDISILLANYRGKSLQNMNNYNFAAYLLIFSEIGEFVSIIPLILSCFYLETEKSNFESDNMKHETVQRPTTTDNTTTSASHTHLDCTES